MKWSLSCSAQSVHQGETARGRPLLPEAGLPRSSCRVLLGDSEEESAEGPVHRFPRGPPVTVRAELPQQLSREEMVG